MKNQRNLFTLDRSFWRIVLGITLLMILVACKSKDIDVTAVSTVSDVTDMVTHTPNLPTKISDPITVTPIIAKQTPLASATMPPPTPTSTPHPIPESGWWMYTNGNDARDLAIYQNTLWAATGGGVVAWDLTTGEAAKYTAVDGLAHNDTNAIVVCPIPEMRIVAGTRKGISVYDPETDSWTQWMKNTDMPQDEVLSLFCSPNSQELIVGYSRNCSSLDLSFDRNFMTMVDLARS